MCMRFKVLFCALRSLADFHFERRGFFLGFGDGQAFRHAGPQMSRSREIRVAEQAVALVDVAEEFTALRALGPLAVEQLPERGGFLPGRSAMVM